MPTHVPTFSTPIMAVFIRHSNKKAIPNTENRKGGIEKGERLTETWLFLSVKRFSSKLEVYATPNRLRPGTQEKAGIVNGPLLDEEAVYGLIGLECLDPRLPTLDPVALQIRANAEAAQHAPEQHAAAERL